MRKVKKDYEICSRVYQTTMSRLSGEPTTTTTPMPTVMHSNFMKQQQFNPNFNNSSYVSLETTTIVPSKNNASNNPEEEDHIKTVCWWV